MNIVVVSAFRDASQRQIERWVGQVCALGASNTGGTVRAVAVEGDSVDDTAARIASAASGAPLRVEVATLNTGAPRYGSTEQPERMAALSLVGNELLRQASLESDEVVLYVESDLLWDPTAVWGLVVGLAYGDVVSPLVFAGECFYDVWAFRGLDGSRFAPFSPYHETLSASERTEVSSVGSCLAMKREVAANCSIKNGGALVDFCGDVRDHGYRILVDPTLRVYHP